MRDIDLDDLLKRVERLEEFVGIVKRHGYPIPGTIPQVDPSYWQTEPLWGDRNLGKGGSITSTCAFDSLPPEDRMKPMGLSCGCPKCTPYSMGVLCK